ncbi:MAG: hypothetical protein M1814_000135 [Vezdaea aestivalis]|nr:MAG: hypothetical protein M1814_000135 [Vezdaea aestivalis]
MVALSSSPVASDKSLFLPHPSKLATRPMDPHPLVQLTVEEHEAARQALLSSYPDDLLQFRSLFLEEPPKAQLQRFLEAEREGSTRLQHPPRVARVQYDVVHKNGAHDYSEALIDVASAEVTWRQIVDSDYQPSFTMDEFVAFQDACASSHLYKDAIAEFDLPKGFIVTTDPWPYGSRDSSDMHRWTVGLCYARDGRHNNEDSNHYGYPIPIIPVLDTHTGKIVRIDRLATGGKRDGLAYGTHKPNVLDHCNPAEYLPELLEEPLRQDLKPLNVIQPDGPSFSVTDNSLIEWQKWKFRVGFNPREGATIHDVTYDGRSVIYRISVSEMTVPYADPRPPFHKKQAFDFGDGGAGRAANNLELGCDCLGVIKYLDGLLVKSNGEASVAKNVICIHEQDNGIGWKHSNFRTDRAVVTRNRELVIQFIITLANYEYIFAYIFDQAGGITVETRATGIVSVVNIDAGKTSDYGNVVAPGVLAQNHQHIFCVRIDPAVDGASNAVVIEESLPLPMNSATNPFGNAYNVQQTPVLNSKWIDASPMTNLNIKMTNPKSINPHSKKPVAYKLIPPATQLLLADPDSVQAKRARFAQHHVWVTKFRDNEYWAAGEFTTHSEEERGGVADMVARGDTFDQEGDDVVIWSVFGLTHNPRVEDWPVMPVEIHHIKLRPADFFTKNPALDVPANRNLTSCLAPGSEPVKVACCNGDDEVQRDAASHLQGGPAGDIVPNGEAKTNGEAKSNGVAANGIS